MNYLLRHSILYNELLSSKPPHSPRAVTVWLVSSSTSGCNHGYQKLTFITVLCTGSGWLLTNCGNSCEALEWHSWVVRWKVKHPAFLYSNVIVKKNTKCFVAWQECKGSPMLHFCGNPEPLCIVASYIHASNKRDWIVAFPWLQWLCKQAKM